MTTTYASLLAVDADEARIKTLTHTIKQQGWYAVTTCTNSYTALFMLSSKQFDAVLIDVHEANKNNFEFLSNVQSMLRANPLPVILLAEAVEHDLVTAGLEHGATDYLCVPTNSTILKTRLSIHLQQREITSQAISCLNAFNSMKKLADDLRQIILPLGIALSAENDFDVLLE
ncbi:MAG: response regulator, partial [Chloroflexota bacterium]